jgi:hypothetical protein
MSLISIRDLPNVSLVAFYSNKPSQLAVLLDELQVYLSETKILKGKFSSYQLEQVHGTIIGCEGLKTEAGIINKWFYEKRQEIRYLDISGWLNYLLHSDRLPIQIRFGGYSLDKNYGFLSRNQHPYHRSFQLQPSKETEKIPVLIGWSYLRDGISLDIDNLRRNAQKFNLLHKYHNLPEAIDNDFYLRLGTITSSLSQDEIATIERDIRDILLVKSPVYLSIALENLAFVQYRDLSLPPQTTKILPLSEATVSKLEELY